MERKKFSQTLVSLMLFIFLVNSAAMKFYWYSSIWYFDMFMHFLGGVVIGFIFLYIFPLKENISLSAILKILMLVLLVGVGWEIFEIYVNDVITKNPFNILDTTSDLFFDLAGGAFGILYFLKRIMRIDGNIVQ